MMLNAEGYFLALNLNFAHRETPVTHWNASPVLPVMCRRRCERARLVQCPLQPGHCRCFTHRGCSKISLQKGLYKWSYGKKTACLWSAGWILQQILQLTRKRMSLLFTSHITSITTYRLSKPHRLLPSLPHQCQQWFHNFSYILYYTYETYLLFSKSLWPWWFYTGII